jgi:hypothetical protein
MDFDGEKSIMCIICLQFQKDKDAWDAYQMAQNAKNEKRLTGQVDIEDEHLDAIVLEFAKKAIDAGIKKGLKNYIGVKNDYYS